MYALKRLLRVGGIACAMLAFASCARPPANVGPARDVDSGINFDLLDRILKSAGPSAELQRAYTISEGDVLQIELRGRSDIIPPPNTFEITSSPTLVFPIIGELRVHGKTAAELGQALQLQYSEYIVNPDPIVGIKRFDKHQIQVLGAVRTPGEYAWDPGDTLLSGLLKAGGIAKYSSAVDTLSHIPSPGRYVTLYRHAETTESLARANDGTFPLAGFTTKSSSVPAVAEIMVPIRDYLLHGTMRYDLPLYPNDIVYVRPAGAAIVKGRVFQPGVSELGPSIQTVTDVLTDRGGLRFGAKSEIELIREASAGGIKVYQMDARRMMERQEADIFVESGDQLVVYHSKLRILGEWMLSLVTRSSQVGVRGTVGQ